MRERKKTDMLATCESKKKNRTCELTKKRSRKKEGGGGGGGGGGVGCWEPKSCIKKEKNREKEGKS